MKIQPGKSYRLFVAGQFHTAKVKIVQTYTALVTVANQPDFWVPVAKLHAL
jgi:hypothetical protein